MRYNDKALRKGGVCTAVNPCAECQSYGTNAGNGFLPAVHFW